MAERLMTVEELVEQHMSKIIETEYPLVLELERKLAAVEREMIKKGRNAADFQNITQGLNENA